MRASAFIGRVGGLAVALGVGAVLGGLGLGTASASPSDSYSATDSASSASGPDRPVERSRGSRSTQGAATQSATSSPRAGSAKAATGQLGLPATAAKSSATVAVPMTAATDVPAPSAAQVTSGSVRIPTPVVAAAPPLLAQSTAAVSSQASAEAVDEAAEAVALAAAQPVATTGRVESAVSLLPGSDPSGPAESPLSWAVLGVARRELNNHAAVRRTPTEAVSTSLIDTERVPAAAATIVPADNSPQAVTPAAADVAVDPFTTIFQQIQAVITQIVAVLNQVVSQVVALVNQVVTAIVSVFVPVAPVNTAPTATAPTVGTPDPATGAVTGTVSATDADGDTVTYTAPATTTKGSVAINASTGAFTYTPTVVARENAARAGATAADKADAFTVTVSDGKGGSTPVAVTVAVSPQAATPGNSSPIAGAVFVGTPNLATGVVSGSVTANDPDGDPLTYSAPAATPKGSLTVNGINGAFTYTPTVTARQNAALVGATAADKSDAFTVTVSDGRGGTVQVAVTVSVAPTVSNPTNSAPVAGASTIGTPNPTTGVVTGSVSATDLDGDPLTFSGSTTTSKGVVVVAANGSFTYNPTPTARHAAARIGAPASDTTDSFTISVSDDRGGVATIPVTVIVGAFNTAPTSGTPITGAADATTGQVTGTASFTDTDGDTLTFTGSTTTGQGTVVVAVNGAFTYTPTLSGRQTANSATTDSFVITARDGYGGETTQTITVAVDPGTPTAGTPTVGTPNTSTGVVTGGAVFTDTAGRTLTYSTGGTSAGGATVSVNAATGAFVYTPTQGQRQSATGSTTDTFTVAVSNGVNSTTQIVTVAVDPGTPTAGTPTVGTPNTSTGAVGGGAVFTDTAGRTLAYSTPTVTAGGGSVTIDAVTGLFTYTPTQSQRQAATGSTTDTLTVTASNGVRSTAQTVTVRVLPQPNTLIATISLASTPTDVAVSPDSQRLYIGSGGVLTVVDTNATSDAYNTVIANVSVGTTGDLTLNGDGSRLYGVNPGSPGTLAVINPADYAVTTVAASVNSRTGLVVTPDGSRAYFVTAGGGGFIGVVNTATNAVSSVGVGGTPTGLAISPDGSRVYLNNGSNIRSINTATNAVADTYAGPNNPSALPTYLAVSPDGSRLYVAVQGGSVSVYDTAAKSLVGTVAISGVNGMAPSPSGNYLYVISQSARTVSVVDTSTRAVTKTIAVDDANDIAVSPDGQYVYVTNQAAKSVSIIFAGG